MKTYDWLEGDDEFEGVGAHHDNPRYTPVDEDEFDSVTGKPFPPHNPDFPDVDPATGDERKTEPNAQA